MGISIIAVIIIIDQLTKWLIESNLTDSSIVIINNIFSLTYIQNTGGAWGIFEKYNFIFIIAIPFILITIIMYMIKNKYMSNFERIGLYMLIGGALGNYIDRIVRGYIIDFLDFLVWPVFNFADIFVVVGVGLIIVAYSIKKVSP